MIKVIGTKRIIILLALIGLNAALAAAIYLYVIPESSRTAKKVRTLRSQNQAKQADINRMQIDFEMLGKQRDAFDELNRRGFFKSQVRSVAKKIFKDIQDEAKVVSAVVLIKPGVIEDNEEAKKSNYKVLSSPVKITISSYDDSDIYRYLYIMENKFPGHLSINNMTIKRVSDVSGPALRAIATGGNPVLVTANVDLSWRTMIPESQIIVEENK